MFIYAARTQAFQHSIASEQAVNTVELSFASELEES